MLFQELGVFHLWFISLTGPVSLTATTTPVAQLTIRILLRISIIVLPIFLNRDGLLSRVAGAAMVPIGSIDIIFIVIMIKVGAVHW
jgi:hypothetical protein